MIWIKVFLSPNTQLISRSTLSLFDAIGNTGGIQSILYSLSYSILAILNFNRLDNFIVSHLYSQTEHSETRLDPSS